MKLMAIDGNSLINRAFYGVRMLTTGSGVSTNAVYGFLNTLLKLQSDYGPDAVCVCFDLKAKTFRHIEYEGYKAQRKPMPEELAQQMPLVKQALDLLGIHRLEAEGYEADDLLGTLARLCHEQGHECVIVTGDRDSLQFIAQGATVALVTTKMGQTTTQDFDDPAFRAAYRGLPPEKIVDLKALMGDKSDNIPGVPGIGEKGALDLLERFSSLEGIYEHLDDPKITAATRKKLTEGRQLADLSFRLASGELHAPVSQPLEEMRPQPRRDGELYDFLTGLELRSLIKRLELAPPSGSAASAIFSPPPVSALRTNGELRCLELTGTEPVCAVVTEQLSACGVFCGDKAYAVQASDVGQENFDAFLHRLFGEGVPLCLHDGKQTLALLMDAGIAPSRPAFDTAIAAYLLSPTDGSYALERCCENMLGFAVPESADEEPTLLGQGGSCLEALGIRAAAINALYRLTAPKIMDNQMDSLLRDMELPLIPVLASMQAVGMRLDSGRLRDFGAALTEKIGEAEDTIFRLAGERFNIGSTKQLGSILFEKLGLKAIKKTKTGYSTDVEVLEKLRGSHEIIDAVIDYRKLTKLKSTYVDGLLKVVAADGRVHTTFHQTVTATGRLSSADPNLQNIPIRQQLGTEIRRCFVPNPGNVFLDADYSQIELRILAHIAQDEVMIGAFQTGEDIHTVTASQVFHVLPDQVTSQMRSRAKAVNFGIVYGISAFSLSEDIGVFPKEAQQYIDAYLEKYTGVRRYMESIREKARQDGFVSTLYGRRRWLPELKSANFNTRSFGERVALNTPIQGTAADIIKLAMLRVEDRLRREGRRARLVMQVHDELIIEAPLDERDTVCALLKEEMEGAAQLAVPLTADVSWGDNWYDAKK